MTERKKTYCEYGYSELLMELSRVLKQHDRLVKLLEATVDQYDGIDNGLCTCCRGYRNADLKGNVLPCENPDCLMYKIDHVFEAENLQPEGE